MPFSADPLLADTAALLPRQRRFACPHLCCEEAAGMLEIPLPALTSRLARARYALQGSLPDQARTVS